MHRAQMVSRLAALAIFAVASSGIALAADKKVPLPTQDAPDENALIACPEYGEGFFRAGPGETCLKVSGYVRAEASYVTSGSKKPKNYYVTRERRN